MHAWWTYREKKQPANNFSGVRCALAKHILFKHFEMSSNSFAYECTYDSLLDMLCIQKADETTALLSVFWAVIDKHANKKCINDIADTPNSLYLRLTINGQALENRVSLNAKWWNHLSLCLHTLTNEFCYLPKKNITTLLRLMSSTAIPVCNDNALTHAIISTERKKKTFFNHFRIKIRNYTQTEVFSLQPKLTRNRFLGFVFWKSFGLS